MPFAEWIPRLEVRVPVLDAQHQVLFSWLNRLWDSYQSEDAEGLKEVLAFLKDYTELHFGAEENLMDEACYADAARHKVLHQEFRDKLSELEERMAHAPHSVGPALLEYLREWLVHHIAQEDRRLGAVLVAKGIG